MTTSKQPDEATRAVIRWMLAQPVLAQHLWEIAEDGEVNPDRDQELACTVIDLLDSGRSGLWADVLRAAGGQEADTDALWGRLGGAGCIHRIDWQQVRQALLNRHLTED